MIANGCRTRLSTSLWQQPQFQQPRNLLWQSLSTTIGPWQQQQQQHSSPGRCCLATTTTTTKGWPSNNPNPRTTVHGSCSRHAHHAPRRTVTPATSTVRPFSSSTTTTSDNPGSSSSSNKSTFSLNPVEWFRNSQDRKEQQSFIKRIDSMANQETYTLGDMLDELNSNLNNWRAKLPGLSSSSEVKNGKKMQRMIQGLIDVLENNPKASFRETEALTKVQKLKAANAAEVTLAELNVFLHQFDTLCSMQRVMRQRKLRGKSLPTTPESAQAIMHREVIHVLTPKQKEQIRKKAEQQHRNSKNK
ncbi:hypothetical protein ACA910_005544 [Epithemia clementina (nom. ined.)]